MKKQVNDSPLFEKAKSILLENWKDGFTVPTHRLYPFQWNWDSGFVAIGQAHFDGKMAMRELKTLFTGQWLNGLLPHIIFHDENVTTYFPNHPFWKTSVNPAAPQNPKTSGTTQPPVQGWALEKIYDLHSERADIQEFVKEMWPKVLHAHQFLYQYRDPHEEGLVYIYHPWESGRDNSPLWDEAVYSMTIKEGDLPPYERQDNKIADPSERPTQAWYDRFVFLLELGKKNAYAGPGIFRESPFLMQDTLFNAILIRSNESLIRLGEKFGFDTRQVEAWQAKSIARFNEKLWDEEQGTYLTFDLRRGRPVPLREIGALVALLAGIPSKEQAKKMVAYLEGLRESGFFLVPTFEPGRPHFDSKRYWRGPVWLQMNLLVYQGLKRYGLHELATQVKKDTLDLVNRFDFFEYYEPEKAVAEKLKTGYGGGAISWAASSVIEFLQLDE